MKRFQMLLVLLTVCSISALAQKITVTGVAWDETENDALAGVSVSLLEPKDSSVVAGVITNPDGKFTFANQKAGKYILRMTYVGFLTHYAPLTLTKSKKEVDLGVINMQADAKMLKEATVTAALAQVEVKADTFVYNADAYRLPEGSALEDLVRKLPGAEVGEDGTIKINGKSVSKIMMKGKELFGNDKDMALKNLSTKIVEKIKAYERKSDYSRITGIDDGEEETVLDLTVKRGMGEGWMINVDAAAGNAKQDEIPNAPKSLKFPKPLYTGMFNANRFTDNLQFMFVANRNNINNGSGRWGGWGGGSGVTTTTMTGLNVTWTNGKPEYTAGYLEVGGNVRYNERESENMTLSNSEMFLGEKSSSFSNRFSNNWSKNRNLNADLRLEWMPDSMTTLTFRPSFGHSQNKNRSNGISATFNQNPFDVSDNPLADYKKDSLFADNEIRVNSEVTESRSYGTGNNGNMNMQLNRRLAKPGRNVTLDLSGSVNKNDNDSYNWSDIYYYQEDRRKLQDRYTLSPSKSWNVRSRFSYSEPLTRKLNLQLSYQYQRRFSDNDRSMYNLENLIGQQMATGMIDENQLYDIFTNGINPANAFAGGLDWQQLTLDAMNSQYATYKENNHNANLMFRYTNKLENGQELRLNAGMSAQPQTTLMHYTKGSLDTTVTRTTFNWAPRMDFRWKISNVSQLRVNYNARMNQPSMTQLMEVTDDSNPLNVNTGNAGLRSSWNNDMYAEYNGYRTASQTSWNIRGGFNNTQNSISSATIYDSNSGARYTRPMNIDGNWGSWGNINLNTALGEKKYWNISNGVNLNYNYRLGYLSTKTDADMQQFIDPTTGRVNMDKLFNEIDLGKSATKTMGIGDWARINYRYTFLDDRWSVDFTANAGFNYNHTRSTQQSNNIDSWNFNYGGNATLMFPWNVTFTTNISEQSRRGYDDKNMNTNELIWNSSLQKSFLKGNAATIKVEWNDMLHQRSNVSRAISEFSRTDTYTNNMNSYFMVHFIYRLNLMGNKETRGMMMPGGPGGGHGGWGGPGGGGGWGGGAVRVGR